MNTIFKNNSKYLDCFVSLQLEIVCCRSFTFKSCCMGSCVHRLSEVVLQMGTQKAMQLIFDCQFQQNWWLVTAMLVMACVGDAFSCWRRAIRLTCLSMRVDLAIESCHDPKTVQPINRLNDYTGLTWTSGLYALEHVVDVINWYAQTMYALRVLRTYAMSAQSLRSL